jgi:hypothetical protein
MPATSSRRLCRPVLSNTDLRWSWNVVLRGHSTADIARRAGLSPHNPAGGELVTSARKCAPGPALMDLRIVGDLVEIVVWDSAPVLPVARAADAGRVGQHGMEIVMMVAQGFEVQMEPVGKRITVRIALLDDPGGAVTGRRPQ